jgi:hypothetical protein
VQDNQTENDRVLLEKVAEIAVKYADEWAGILEGFWKVSGNPAFAWLAMQLLCDPRRPAMPLPAWVTGCLWEAASNLGHVIFGLPPKEGPALLGQAIGLSAPKRSIIADAQALWDAPRLLGTYEEIRDHAPIKGRAERARAEIGRLWGMQSGDAVERRLSEARAMVRAVIEAQGKVADDDAVSRTCAEVVQMRRLLAGFVGGDLFPAENAEQLRASFEVPPARRDAIRAALDGGLPKPPRHKAQN